MAQNGESPKNSASFLFAFKKASLDPYLAFLFLEVLGLCARTSTSYLLYKRLDSASLSYFSLYEQIILYFGFQNLQESQKWTIQGDGWINVSKIWYSYCLSSHKIGSIHIQFSSFTALLT